jgi:hypothetical protein
MEDAMSHVYRICRCCHDADPTVSYRPHALAVLCAACNLDLARKAQEATTHSLPLDLVRYSPAALAAMNAQ